MKVVISLGGSIFLGDEKINLDYLREFSEEIKKLKKEGHTVMIVAGGGKIARKYIEAARAFGASEHECDLLGIKITRLNAEVLRQCLKEHALDFVPEKTEEVDKNEKRIVVMGGTAPGHTTDAVSAMLALQVNADLLVIATNINGVYDSDPKQSKNAKRFKKLSPEKLVEIVKIPEHKAGYSSVVDMKAANLINKNKIKTKIVDGRKVENIIKAIKGEDISEAGTIIE